MGRFDELAKTGAMLPVIGEKCALLVSGKDKPNAMTIGWGAASVMWGKSVFLAPVRKTRYSHELLEAHGEFTVFVPADDMKQTIAVCGSKSGRDIDKIAECGLKLAPSTAVSVPHIDAPGLVLECRVLYKTDLVEEDLDAEMRERWYSGGNAGNPHTFYFAEILAQYEQA